MNSPDTPLLIRAKTRHTTIKNYYLSCGHDEQQWHTVNHNPQLFNAVWRRMLGIPSGNMPPPEAMRR